jgi:hypothetical protein
VIVAFLYETLNRAGGEPVGGTNGFPRALEILGIFMGPLASVLIGAEAGAGDSTAGVFRELVITGRSRAALFAVRIPGALMLNSLIVSLGFLAVLVGTFLLAGSAPLPSLSTILEAYAWSLLVDGAVCVVAVGLASLTGSRPATITALIGFELIASPILLQTASLGHAREALLDASVLHLAPVLSHGAPVLAESTSIVLVVLAAYVTLATAAGAWRTLRTDA